MQRSQDELHSMHDPTFGWGPTHAVLTGFKCWIVWPAVVGGSLDYKKSITCPYNQFQNDIGNMTYSILVYVILK